jgi:broad specificity phosphatase PhoE
MDVSGIGSVYLMRHGSTVLDVEKRSDGWLDMPLSDTGRLGLMPAQQLLKTVPIYRIYTADLKRTLETAQLIKSGTASDPKIVTSENARTWNLGVLAGTRKRYGRPEVQKLIDNPTKTPLGGESFEDFCDRFWPWFTAKLKTASRSKPILYVGSGSNMRLIGQKLLDNPDALDLDEGALACLHHANSTWHCEILVNNAKELGDCFERVS